MLEKDTELEQDDLELEEDLDDEEKDEEKETDESEKDDETDDEGDKEEDDSDEEKSEDKPNNRDQKIEKRISSLTAKLKAKDEELAEARERISDLEKNVEEEHQYVISKLPAWEIKGRSIYEMSNDEFDDAVDFIYELDIPAEEKRDRVKTAREARREYFKQVQPIALENQQVTKEAETLWQKDWTTVETELLEMYPEIQGDIPRVKEYIQKELQKRPLLVKRLRQNIVQKFKYTLDVLKELGIDKKLEQEEYAKDTAPGLKAGKGKASPSKSKTPTFTRAQIGKMSLADYEKNEKAIDAALKAGRIR